jgi:hypothetical protein
MIIGSDEIVHCLVTNNQASLEYSLLKFDEDWNLMECECNSLYSHTTMDSDLFMYKVVQI